MPARIWKVWSDSLRIARVSGRHHSVPGKQSYVKLHALTPSATPPPLPPQGPIRVAWSRQKFPGPRVRLSCTRFYLSRRYHFMSTVQINPCRTSPSNSTNDSSSPWFSVKLFSRSALVAFRQTSDPVTIQPVPAAVHSSNSNPRIFIIFICFCWPSGKLVLIVSTTQLYLPAIPTVQLAACIMTN